MCLEQCPISTHQPVGRECVLCDGPCPRGILVYSVCISVPQWYQCILTECPGGTVTEESDAVRTSIINCTIVTENLFIGIPPISGFT